MVVLWPSNVHCHVHTHIHTHAHTLTFYKEKGELRKTSNVNLWSPHSCARMCIYAHKHIYVHIHHIKHTKDAKMPDNYHRRKKTWHAGNCLPLPVSSG